MHVPKAVEGRRAKAVRVKRILKERKDSEFELSSEGEGEGWEEPGRKVQFAGASQFYLFSAASPDCEFPRLPIKCFGLPYMEKHGRLSWREFASSLFSLPTACSCSRPFHAACCTVI